jgi:hypothetical protein
LLIRLERLSNVDEEAHAVLIIFILEGKVDVMGAWRNHLKTFEKGASLPELIVNAELEAFWAIYQEQEAPLSDLRVGQILIWL